MKRSEHLLTCLAEECAEVAQRVSKALRFGLEEIQPGQSQTNGQRIVDEYADLQAVMAILEDEGILRPMPAKELGQAMEAKREKVGRYLAYSKRQGTLDNG